MDEAGFWELVQTAHDVSRGNMDLKCTSIRAAVALLPRDSALDFARLFARQMHKAFTWELWGAAYIINNGCSDDSFHDFRASLISRGRSAFERAVADPDGLAAESIDTTAWFYEGYQYAVREGAEIAYGSKLPPGEPHPVRPIGTRWEEDKVYDLYPKLKRRYAWRLFLNWLFRR